MPVIRSDESEREALLHVSKLMVVSARTAPKSAGVDDILIAVLFDEEKDSLASEMEKIGDERKIENFRRDAKNLRDSEIAVLVGVRGTKSLNVNCGACGYSTCSEFNDAQKKAGKDFMGPTCILKALDLGIALGSAAKTASLHNVDNRIMYRIGVAARRLNLLSEATVIMGIPMSAKGKNIYFDRK